MITTVIIVIIILVLLVILVLKWPKSIHITWYWCQDLRDSYMVEKGPKISGKALPPLFGPCPERKVFSYVMCFLRVTQYNDLSMTRMQCLRCLEVATRPSYRWDIDIWWTFSFCKNHLYRIQQWNTSHFWVWHPQNRKLHYRKQKTLI